MKEVILSHDSEALLCLVPHEVAEDLEKYCFDFAVNWVWKGPEKERFLRPFGEGLMGVCFGAEDFIDYLARHAFPDRPAGVVRGLGCYDYEIPAEFDHLPRYNF